MCFTSNGEFEVIALKAPLRILTPADLPKILGREKYSVHYINYEARRNSAVEKFYYNGYVIMHNPLPF